MSLEVFVPAQSGRMAHWVRFRSRRAKLLRHDATTTPRTIHVAGDTLSARLYAHEYGHLPDWQRYGTVGFRVRYVGEWVLRVLEQLVVKRNWRTTFAAAYRAISFERRADAYRDAHLREFRDLRAVDEARR